MIFTVAKRNKSWNWIHIWSKQISNATSKTLNCHWARTTMVNIRTLALNDWDFRTISNFRTISGQLCNFRNFRTASNYYNNYYYYMHVVSSHDDEWPGNEAVIDKWTGRLLQWSVAAGCWWRPHLHRRYEYSCRWLCCHRRQRRTTLDLMLTIHAHGNPGQNPPRTKSPPIVEKKFETSVETWFLVMSHRPVTRVYVIVHEFRQWWSWCQQ